ncbi:hypothetical protein [Brevundimonas sp.]|uniref:hypothetical protein n=1 Tax=Brevundimonas sp. TaxID=1871086 RepID=UPI002D762112|nr:hypothetical protein [Brevundimonas sp.]HYC99427.1 hypothetical protein [Brevundimonas sp.]
MRRLVDEDRRARRNRDTGGLWLINLLVSALIATLGLYVVRADDTRHDARTAAAMVAALPGQIATTPAMAASRED